MYYGEPTLADITVEQYSAMALSINTHQLNGSTFGQIIPAEFDYKQCSAEGYERLFSMGAIRHQGQQHYILARIGVKLVEKVLGCKIIV